MSDVTVKDVEKLEAGSDQLFRVHATQIGDVFQLQLDCNGCRQKEERIAALESERDALKSENSLMRAGLLDAGWTESDINWMVQRQRKTVKDKEVVV